MSGLPPGIEGVPAEETEEVTKPQPSKTKEQAKVKKTAVKSPQASNPAAKAPAKKAAVKKTVAPVKAPAVKKAAAKTPAKPAAKTIVKPAPKPAPKPAAKAAPAAAKTPAKKATVKTATPPAAAKASATSVPKAAVAPAPKPVAPAPVPVSAPKASRSSKLSFTVPSMPPAVASTAAKASFTKSMSTPALAPPPNVPIKKDPKLANNWKTKMADQLTDAEILAMPDTEYMNDKQMAFFRLKLSQLKQDMLDNAGETTEHLREDTVVVPDPADRATIEEEHALELRTRDRERKLLKKIEQSIQRIDAGDYGYCDETGEHIGVGRLLARPTATLSLEAQQRRELKQKMFGD